VTIGGGTIQDLTAFISSIFFRGINWIFIPTTLLAQCDSCIGGKTSINIHGIKNQLGNFYPPSKIFINFSFLKNIPRKELKSGLGEMSHFYFVSGKKDFMLFDKYLKKALNRKLNILKIIIKRSLNIKKKFIEKDEFDKGPRLILNYGHTFGHAIEKITNYKIPHGMAVAHGINMSNFVSLKMKYINEYEFRQMSNTLNKLLKEDKIKNLNIEELIKALKKDKKNLKGSLRLVLTRGLGKMFLKKIHDLERLKNILIEYQNRHKK